MVLHINWSQGGVPLDPVTEQRLKRTCGFRAPARRWLDPRQPPPSCAAARAYRFTRWSFPGFGFDLWERSIRATDRLHRSHTAVWKLAKSGRVWSIRGSALRPGLRDRNLFSSGGNLRDAGLCQGVFNEFRWPHRYFITLSRWRDCLGCK